MSDNVVRHASIVGAASTASLGTLFALGSLAVTPSWRFGQGVPTKPTYGWAWWTTTFDARARQAGYSSSVGALGPAQRRPVPDEHRHGRGTARRRRVKAHLVLGLPGGRRRRDKASYAAEEGAPMMDEV